MKSSRMESGNSPRARKTYLLAVLVFLVPVASHGVAAQSSPTPQAVTARPNSVIYKSVDAQGRISYGDQPGLNAVASQTLERPVYEQVSGLEELQSRLDQMAATTKRLQDDRVLRAKLRQNKVAASKEQSQPAPVIVEQRVYRPQRRHPYLYKPHYYDGHRTSASRHSSPSLGLHLRGGSSSFRYGLSYGHQHGRRTELETPGAHHRERSIKRGSSLGLPKVGRAD
ncbi:MAG: DUF4124 domain-containing protein [Porticoccaceae bacterium]|nr:DUF4124 domain-containing protein [Porticoccaceae bacterium]